ncbi:MAG: SWIM zinc finger family protein, partial [Pyrinomonadaceae bacterium]|nr:SWIM zinc finger family protein [Pyrinomonadaceae bacterium]
MSANIAAGTDRKALMRDKRAQGIAAMGLVTREGDRFRVATPTLRGRKSSYEVWRDEAGKVRCSCLEYEEQATEDTSFRCEHILAVKHSLLAKNTEAITKQQPSTSQQPTTEHSAVKQSAAAPNTNANASERRETTKAESAASVVARSEREQAEVEETKTAAKKAESEVSNVRSLANHTNIEEQEMSKNQERTKTAIARAIETEDAREMALTAEPVAPVVPLAFTNTLRALKQQVDPNVIKTREGWKDRQGNTHMVEYVEWHTVADILD